MITELETILNREKENYTLLIKRKIAKGKTLVIYGAGRIGQELYNFLREQDIDVKCFCVSDIKATPSIECDVPVYGIDSLDVTGNVTFLIGVKPSLEKVIANTLEARGYKDYIKLPSFAVPFIDPRFRRPLIQVTPITGCSVNCRYCPQELFVKKFFATSKHGTMTFAEYKTCLDKTPMNTVIEFAGFVEPFLNKDAPKMMRYTYETGREVNLFTTLVGLTEDGWNKIRDIPFNMVVMHLPDEKNYANIPTNETYWKILREMVDKKKPDGRPYIDRANCQSTIRADVMNVVKDKVFIDNIQLVDRAGNLEDEFLQTGGVPKGPLFCPTHLNLDHNILLADGRLVLCCMDFGMQHVLGNLLTQSYEEIMTGTVMKDIVKKMCAEESDDLLCRKCVRALPLGEFI